MSSDAETDFDNVLKEINKQIPASKIDDLGKALGFLYPEIENFIATNTSTGTLKMLREWREKQTNPDEKAALRKCLQDAGLNRLANLPILQDGHHSGMSGGQARRLLADGQEDIPVASSASNVDSSNPMDRKVSDKELLTLAKNLPANSSTALAIYLGVSYIANDNIRRENPSSREDGNLKMLMEWKCKKGGGKVVDLDKALDEADCGGIKYKDA